MKRWKFFLVILLGLGLATVFFVIKSKNKTLISILPSYHGNIVKETQNNDNFRKVLFTGSNSQLVIMSIPPGGEVGAETHKYTEQTLFFLSGTGKGELNG